MSTPIALIDYGAGNEFSLSRGLESAGGSVTKITSTEQLDPFSHIVLPGVGAFGAAVLRLKRTGLDRALCKAVKQGKVLLGICLGMQLLYATSDESDGFSGLGLLPGHVTHLPDTGSKVQAPHMGFNSVNAGRGSVLFDTLPPLLDFYFAHSYACPTLNDQPNLIQSTTEYGEEFVSHVELNKQVFGIQFHPELSHVNGIEVLRNFISVTC